MFDVVLAYVPLNQAKVFRSSRPVGAELFEINATYGTHQTETRGLDFNTDGQLVP